MYIYRDLMDIQNFLVIWNKVLKCSHLHVLDSRMNVRKYLHMNVTISNIPSL